MMKTNWIDTMRRLAVWLFLGVILLPGCRKQGPEDALDEETRSQRLYANMFAYNVMDTYYLWRDEVDEGMKAWLTTDEPIGKVADLRYKDAKGKDIDRWTVLTDDFAGMRGSVSGHTRSFGLDFMLFYADRTQSRIYGVVTFTYADSPAEKAGLARGDIFRTVDGKELTPGNYVDLLSSSFYGGGSMRLGLEDGRSVSMTAVDMYENPILKASILEQGDKKVGYLHYTSFTLDSCEELIDIFRGFTEAGIDEMVLDLRYNGGGYVTTEELLASMLAPREVVSSGKVFSTEVYNARLAEEWGDEPSCFRTSFEVSSGSTKKTLSTEGVNPDLKRLYVLVGGASASASESLVCGLRPYMDVILIGQQTYGKYCAGAMIGAESWFDTVKDDLEDGVYEKALPYVDNWGIYVMYARYADCNGRTLSMPDGIVPDVEGEDNPMDGFALGDPSEALLSVALGLMGGHPAAGTRAAGRSSGLEFVAGAPLRPGFGVLVGELP